MKLRTKDELIDYANYGNNVKYIFFWGHKKVTSSITKSCFSQWYEIEFKKDELRFISAEHYMMYEKANLFGDKLSCEKILSANSPGEAKDLGRKVIGFNEEVWLKLIWLHDLATLIRTQKW
ncbi:MAG: NADAR family protein [Epsilonproteobacteria bacterium]|nr:NADAR family protein [Campylobacterota bacterium]